MELTSAAYDPSGAIPFRHTCDGENVSPSFRWTDPPSGTKSFVLLFQNSDAPRQGGFTHWVLYDIGPVHRQIDENVPHDAGFVDCGVQGSNDSGQLGYMGPSSPSRVHHYVARLFALDIELNLDPGATWQQVAAAMEGRILDQAALTGTYAGPTGN
jgi:Raf kinase inhibitor-like YbhB/YbcL family protein